MTLESIAEKKRFEGIYSGWRGHRVKMKRRNAQVLSILVLFFLTFFEDRLQALVHRPPDDGARGTKR